MENRPYAQLLFDGVVAKNPLFITGLVISPAVFCADSIRGGLTAAICFTLITALTAGIIALLPAQKIIYTLRIILYTGVAALVCGGVLWVVERVFAAEVAEFLVFLQCMCVNSLILERFDKRQLDKKRKKLFFIITSVIGFDFAILIFAAVREIVSYGTFYGNIVSVNIPFPVFGYVFGGFILLGLFSGIFKLILQFFGIYGNDAAGGAIAGSDVISEKNVTEAFDRNIKSDSNTSSDNNNPPAETAVTE
jgi:Na+-transporting NADH:ubiquinone oxidoreductase subunit NqrD